MLMAVTTSDGIHVDTHFGRAERFLLFELSGEAPRLVGEVAADPYCNWSSTLQDLAPEQFAETVKAMQECADDRPAHSMMPEKLASIAKALGGCRVIVTAMIGESPEAELERLGIAVYSASGPISTLLPEVAKIL
ncbi:MAG: dinitrogenase iron-molybdenum cofactor biosynthesis protein [Geobacteraceae bacterium]|nr:dinitrogenase iron-molybdenum cofactor biosynthesis protein [Geobacteraceae bacterium]